jgi:hypothetical protein
MATRRETEMIRKLSKMRPDSKQFIDQKNRIIRLKITGKISNVRRSKRNREETTDFGS